MRESGLKALHGIDRFFKTRWVNAEQIDWGEVNGVRYYADGKTEPAPASDAAPDWAQFRAALEATPAYLELLSSQPLAASLETAIWNKDWKTAANRWSILRENGAIAPELESAIAQAAISCNLPPEVLEALQ